MTTDALILKRFGELTELAERVEKSRQTGADHSAGVDSALFRQWEASAQSLIERACGLDTVHDRKLKERCGEFKGYWHEFRDCHAVFVAALNDYQGGYLFSMRALIDAEICSDVLDQADVLLAANFKDAACIIAGVALETAILEMSKAKQLPAGKLDTMNSALAKAGAYNVGMQKQVTAWADLRNRAAHGKWSEYVAQDVRDLIDGVRRFVAEKM